MKILRFLKNSLANIFTGLLVTLFIPVIVGGIVYFMIWIGYTMLWTFIRRDPRVKFEFPEVEDVKWRKAKTQVEIQKYFEDIMRRLAELGNAKLEINKEDIENLMSLEHDPKQTEWIDLELRASLMSKHARFDIVYTFGAKNEGEELNIYAISGDELEIWAVLKDAFLSKEFSLYVSSAEAAWAVVSALRGDNKFSLRKGQPWFYVKEYDVWLVHYEHDDSPTFGYRKTFDGREAHIYRFDGKPPAKTQE